MPTAIWDIKKQQSWRCRCRPENDLKRSKCECETLNKPERNPSWVLRFSVECFDAVANPAAQCRGREEERARERWDASLSLFLSGGFLCVRLFLPWALIREVEMEILSTAAVHFLRMDEQIQPLAIRLLRETRFAFTSLNALALRMHFIESTAHR